MLGLLNSLLGRLMLGGVLPGALVIAVAIVAVTAMSRLQSALGVETHTHEVIARAAGLKAHLAGMRSAVHIHGLLATPAQRAEYQELHRQLVHDLAVLGDLVADNPDQQVRINSLREHLRLWDNLAGSVFKAERPLTATMSELVRQGQTIHRAIEAFLSEENRLLESRQERARALRQQSSWIIGLTALASLLVSVLAALAISRQIRQPLGELETAAAKLVCGAFTPLEPSGPAEIARLTAHFNQMGQSLSERGAQLYRVGAEVERRNRALAAEIVERELAETELKKAAAAIQELNEHLVQRTMELTAINRELESFSYSVSHDLRAPLRSIDGFSLALLEDHGPRLDAQARDYLHRVRAASQRMGVLIDDLLKLSRLSRAEFRREAVDLSAAAREVVAGLRLREPGRDVQVTVEDGLQTRGDPTLLGVVLENLLDNAWKYTGKTPQAWIEFKAVTTPDGPAFCVRDNGAGFDMTFAKKLFAPFQRLHASGDFPGTGIGLATVQRIIHRHGGKVWADATVDRGAAFFFILGSREAEV